MRKVIVDCVMGQQTWRDFTVEEEQQRLAEIEAALELERAEYIGRLKAQLLGATADLESALQLQGEGEGVLSAEDVMDVQQKVDALKDELGTSLGQKRP